MKFKPVLLILSLALFIQEIRQFIAIGGLHNELALSLGKLIVYCMTVALISLDYATCGRIWSQIDMAMKLAT